MRAESEGWYAVTAPVGAGARYRYRVVAAVNAMASRLRYLIAMYPIEAAMPISAINMAVLTHLAS